MESRLPSIPEAISDLKSLRYLAKRSAEGTLSGVHRSGLFGSSIEFADHKPYSAGDDLRHVDWKVYGRADKFYIKRFEDETNIRCYILIDASNSMNFGTIGYTKFDFARVMAAALAYLFIQQQDLVGMLLFGSNNFVYTPPRGHLAHFNVLTQTLLEHVPTGTRKLEDALGELRTRIHRSALVIVLSDFISDLSSLRQSVQTFHGKSHQMVWLQILDSAEVRFPFQNRTRFKGMEDEDDVETQGHLAKPNYLQALSRWQKSISDLAHEKEIDHIVMETNIPLMQALGMIHK